MKEVWIDEEILKPQSDAYQSEKWRKTNHE